MFLFRFFSRKRPSAKGFQPQSNSAKVQGETFILEPIWTPSGLVDGGDDTPNPGIWDVNPLSLDEIELPDGDSWEGADDAGFEVNGSTQLEAEVDEGEYVVADSLLETSFVDEEIQEIPFITSVDEATDGVTNIVHETTEGELSGEGNDSVEILTANQPADEKASEEIAHYELTAETEAIASEPTGDELAEDNIDSELSDPANESEDEQLALALDSPQPTYEGGIFTVGEAGEVSIDFLYDGGKYKGELAIFSWDGMDEFELGSEDFIREAASRALSDSEFGHVVISDPTEGAKFSGWLGESDRNAGEYFGAKTFAMRPGDRFGLMLVPNGQVQQVFDNPEVGGAIRPLFSLASANPDDAFHVGQIADVTGDGNTFVMEDLRVDTRSDLDYNDLIFRVEGATGETVSLDDVIDLDRDWRDTALGKELLEYAASFLEPDDPIIVLAPEGQTQIDLESLFPELPEEESWVFEILDEGTQNLAPQIEGEDVLIVQTQPDADIDRIAVRATNNRGETYIQRPILLANGPDPATTERVVDLLDDFGEVFEELSDTADLESTEELSAVVERLDRLIEEQPKTLKFLIKPELLETLNFEPSQVGTAYQVIHSESVGQLLGLQASLHKALTGSDPGAWEQFMVEAHDLPSVTEGDDEFPFVGFIDFAAQEHDENTVGIFQSIDGLTEQEYSLVHADDGDWAERLIELVDEAKANSESGAIINLGFDLTQFDDLQHTTTRYELTPTEQQAIQYAQDNGVLLVVAAGNTGDRMSALGEAAKIFTNILVVGSVNRWEEKADYSSKGNTLSLVAPGGEWADDPNGFVGTSKSTAYVTAAISLLWKANPELNYQQVKDILLKTADDLEAPGWDPETGAGLLDFAEAIILAQQTQGTPVTEEIGSVDIEPFSGEGRVDPLARPASDPRIPAIDFLNPSSDTRVDLWDALLDSEDAADSLLAEQVSESLDQYQNLKAEVDNLSMQERLLEESFALVEQQTQVEASRAFTLQNEYQTLTQELQSLSFQKFLLENQTAIYEAFINGQGTSLQQKLQNAEIEIGEGSQGEILAARIIELENAIAREQLALNKTPNYSSEWYGIRAESDAYNYELKAVQDLLTIDGVQKLQEIERINLELAQKQERLDDIEKDLANSQENLIQLDLQLETIPNELEAIRLAQEEKQDSLRSLLEIGGFSLPYRERIDATKRQVDYLEKRFNEVGGEDENIQNAVSKELEWAKAHLSVLEFSAPFGILLNELSRLITDLKEYQSSGISGDLPTQEYIDYLEDILRNQQEFLKSKDDIAQKKQFAELTYTSTEKALQDLWNEHVQLTLDKATESQLDEKYQAIQLTERYVEQVKVFANNLQNWETFLTQVDGEIQLHEQRAEQWEVLNQAQRDISQGLSESLSEENDLQPLLLELEYLSSQNELLKTTTQLETQQSLLEELLAQDELLKEKQLYYYNLALQHEDNTWAYGFYSASEADAALENHQEASLIAEQRNKLWVQTQAALGLLSDLEAQKLSGAEKS